MDFVPFLTHPLCDSDKCWKIFDFDLALSNLAAMAPVHPPSPVGQAGPGQQMQHAPQCHQIQWGFGWDHWMAKLTSHLEERCQCKLCQCKALWIAVLGYKCIDVGISWQGGRSYRGVPGDQEMWGCSAPHWNAGKSRMGARTQLRTVCANH